MFASCALRLAMAVGPKMDGMKALANAILAPETLKKNRWGILRRRTRVRFKIGTNFAGISAILSVGS